MKKARLLFVLLFPFVGYGQTITTVAGTGSSGYNGDGISATSAKLAQPSNLFIDRLGNLYIDDFYNIRVRKVDNAGIITTVAGTGTAGYSGDGGPATAAMLGSVVGKIQTDTHGNLFIADGNNHRIRKVDAATHIISNYAGNGTSAFVGDNGQATAASLSYPGHLTLDRIGNLYIADVANHRIRKVDTSGIITTYAGNGTIGSSGDGGSATAAELGGLRGLACDNWGNLFFADDGALKVRRVDAVTKIITAVAGNGSIGFAGSGIPATSTGLQAGGITTDIYGSLYIADFHNHRVYKVDTSGIIFSIAGTGISGYNGDGIVSDTAKLNSPYDVAFDLCGNLYIADVNNQRIRKIVYPANPLLNLSGPAVASLGSMVTIVATISNAGGNYSIKWYNKGALFNTTTAPSVTYTKTMCTDSITAVVYGCGDSAVSAVHIVGCNVKVASLTRNERVTCYPNPVSGELIVTASEKIKDILIANLLGEIVFRHAYNQEETVRVNTATLASGLYFVKVNGVYVERVIKE